MTPKTLTLQAFAELPAIWPENIAGISAHGAGNGVVIARIHPDCNRSRGDEDVLVRALVYVEEPTGGLARLTIRRSHTESDKQLYDQSYAPLYRECLYAIWSLPVLELTNDDSND